ncbi:carboxymuconolactone decarboxylase family protein [Flavilitoribacter nigricans]|uniref:Carboxymuconolactone decarboxylase-like domain-containing protein n=1 Tax=Flavilitoribacter nigricans (strain ATCC 23147 / DSM 23189 / NBRC 102662 / NCIMB 1420 / SS-2) TaxID=1122177 RepID=A0A2D0MYE2_FLAN2|nr:carboxymuconolactone decarboxylase family protein [Flavilitoribacter nigricans]PHN00899.1 hypothetical protein CRP01_39865 [Flavilitoribacter nigricans DSM 23189 = NBRC 102662]
MENRIQIDVLEPEAYQAMFALEAYLSKSQINKTHKALIKIRASQINGCSFCIDMHTKEALRIGESPQRLFLLDAWRETSLFTAEERILLEVTEAVTLIHRDGLPEDLYRRALDTFGEHYLSQIIMTITTINAWNRIAVSTHKPITD